MVKEAGKVTSPGLRPACYDCALGSHSKPGPISPVPEKAEPWLFM
jgi:hypothetical protein